MRLLLLLLVIGAVLGGGAFVHSLFSHVGWCAWHVARFAHDIRVHARGWAALQAALAAHSCAKVL